MRAKKILLPFIAMAIIAGLVGCNNDGDSGGTGQLVVKMTDAPFPSDLVSEANVTVTKIEARQKGGDSESAFITIMEDEVSANLLDLTNGVTENLADVEIPEGTYDLIRVYVADATVVLKDGTSYDLKVPSGSSSGIKIFVKPGIEVAGGLTAELLLDFDVASSFVAKGDASSPSGITGFNFKPVIKASNQSFAGRLVGAVTTEVEGETETEIIALGGATVSVYAADTLNTTAITAEDGTYTVLGLQAGLYNVTVELQGYAANTSEGVEIVAANATTQDFVLNPE
ncbi:DUF4382 domain-containing protein [Imperialibacter roseus]|uniref:DUF4382 domain-containing protein n=1 Tax=Imperialibacter roseus TaxID=1324217 RepID=A0ABZ0ISR6_9BACT|nr:DUF4382 domain-containing protein [Imperialibacter roseus]WOK07478.1 DUF4382 domain-containing protein [Imperialibacter roseus]|tara:strand:+ start:37865 stop:38719 length:855 start_codon:yes stop_codon:yes gene_type:complete